MYGSGATVIFSNEERNDMIKIVKAIEDSNILLKGVKKTLQNDIKKGGALPIISMLLGTLASSLITASGLFRAGSGNKCNFGQEMYRSWQGKGMVRAGQGIKKSH